MKVLKSIALGLFLASSTVASVSFAESGDTLCAPAQCIDMIGEKIDVSIDAIEKGTFQSSEIADMIKEGSDLSKEINANDQVDRRRQKANSHLKKARSAAKKGKLDDALEHLKQAKPAFAELKNYL